MLTQRERELRRASQKLEGLQQQLAQLATKTPPPATPPSGMDVHQRCLASLTIAL